MDNQMVSYTDVHSPCWATPQQTSINCFVKFAHIKFEVPFNASPNDSESHGREIFRLCAEGRFGDVAPFSAAANQAYALADPVLPIGGFELWPDVEEFIDSANAEILGQSPRGTVLVWAALVDDLLNRLLREFFVDGDSKTGLLKDGVGALSTFSARAKVAFALGLISRRDLKTCDCIRSVRNEVAHNWQRNLAGESFAKRILKPMQTLYQQDHSEFFVWDDTDLNYLANMIYAKSCLLLTSRLEARRRNLDMERRKEWTD
jgi:DNA-binding MltR family transcriptional regulator